MYVLLDEKGVRKGEERRGDRVEGGGGVVVVVGAEAR